MHGSDSFLMFTTISRYIIMVFRVSRHVPTLSRLCPDYPDIVPTLSRLSRLCPDYVPTFVPTLSRLCPDVGTLCLKSGPCFNTFLKSLFFFIVRKHYLRTVWDPQIVISWSQMKIALHEPRPLKEARPRILSL